MDKKSRKTHNRNFFLQIFVKILQKKNSCYNVNKVAGTFYYFVFFPVAVCVFGQRCLKKIPFFRKKTVNAPEIGGFFSCIINADNFPRHLPCRETFRLILLAWLRVRSYLPLGVCRMMPWRSYA